jgi:parvulin-like peptidyl-prolyl isomerase
MSARRTHVARCFAAARASIAVLVACAAALAQTPAGTSKPDVTATHASVPDAGAVMRIDGREIGAEEFGRWLIDMEGMQLAHSFGEQWLVRRAAQQQNVEVTPEQVSHELDGEIATRIHGAFLDKKAGWLDELRRLGRSEGGHRAQRTVELEPLMLAIELCRRERVVPEEKIRRDWELFYGPGGREYELRGIKFLVEVITPDTGAPREQYDENRRRAFSAQLSKALECRERLNAGEDFGALARELSDDPISRANDGRITSKFRRPGWTDEFVAMLAQMKPGEISQPMYAKGGYWIMQLVSVVTTPYEQVRDQLEQRLIELGPEQDESGATWNRIVKDMHVQILPSMYQEGALTRETTEPVMGLTINGTPVPRAEFATWLLHSRGEADATFFAEHWVTLRKAESLGVTITPEEVEARCGAAMDRMLGEQYDGSREQWLEYLHKHGRDEASFQRQLRRRQYVDGLCEKILFSQRHITEDNVRQRFKQIYGENGRWVEARVIQVEFVPPEIEPGLTREDFDKRLQAARAAQRSAFAKVRERLENGEDFATLARTLNSDANLRNSAGKLSGRFRPDEWPDEVSAEVMALEPGKLAGPLDTGKSFTIFEVVSSRAVPYEEVHDELKHELETARILDGNLQIYRNVLLKEAHFEVLPPMYR